MVCIYCSHKTEVTNSRHQKRLNQVWRRRACTGCGAIFTTIETADASQSISVRKGRTLEPFSRESILFSVYDSLRHRKTAASDATALTATIVSAMYTLAVSATIERDQIVEVTANVLERFDKAAATHYRVFHPLETT